MESQIFGELKETEYDIDWLESKPIEIPYFNNEKFIITLVEKNSEFILNAENAFKNFLKLNNSDRENNSELVIKYYNEVLKAGYTEKLNIKKQSEIWNFVSPVRITILNWSEDESTFICIECGCDWEIEHGLQLTFKNGEILVKANAIGDDIE
jgi:hypothetical protein